MKKRKHRAPDELERAAQQVCREWVRGAELTKIAETFHSARTTEQSAVITAVVVHYRCLVNFVVGDYKGRWGENDICPSDFIGHEWHPSDEDLDRTLRGRLAVLNTEQQHLSWRRLDGAVTLWPIGFLTREVGVAMAEFADVLGQMQLPGTAEFRQARVTVGALLRPRVFDRMTAVTLAPPRS